MKDSLSRMKNKVGAQMRAFIKMKQEKMYIYQFVYVVRYVPIIAPSIYHHPSPSIGLMLSFLLLNSLYTP